MTQLTLSQHLTLSHNPTTIRVLKNTLKLCTDEKRKGLQRSITLREIEYNRVKGLVREKETIFILGQAIL